MSSLALSDSFEYLCYGSTAIRNILYSYSAGIDCSLQNLTATDVRFWRLKFIPAFNALNAKATFHVSYLLDCPFNVEPA